MFDRKLTSGWLKCEVLDSFGVPGKGRFELVRFEAAINADKFTHGILVFLPGQAEETKTQLLFKNEQEARTKWEANLAQVTR